MLDRLSLRARLVLGVIVLAAAGLAAADVATYTSLRSFLFDRTDQSLRQSYGGIARGLFEGCGHDRGRPVPGAEPGDFLQVRSSEGQVICTVQVTHFSKDAPSPPRLPATID